MTPYPTEFPLEEIKNVTTIVQSGSLKEKADLFAHDAWVIIGYGMKFALGPGKDPLIMGAMPPALEQKDGLEALQSMTFDNQQVVQAVPPIVWKKAIKYLLTLVAGML